MNTVSRYSALLVAGLLVVGTAHAQTSQSGKQPAQEGDAQNLYDGSPKVFNDFSNGRYKTRSGTQFNGPAGAQKQPAQESDAQSLYNGSPKVFNDFAKGRYETKSDTQFNVNGGAQR